MTRFRRDVRDAQLKEMHARNARANEERARRFARVEQERAAAAAEEERERAEDAALGLTWDQAAALLKRKASVLARERGVSRVEAAKLSDCHQLLRIMLR